MLEQAKAKAHIIQITRTNPLYSRNIGTNQRAYPNHKTKPLKTHLSIELWQGYSCAAHET